MDYNENKYEILEWIECNLLGLNNGEEREHLIKSILEVLIRLSSDDREILLYQKGIRFVAPIFNCTAEHIFINPLFLKDEQHEPMLAIWLVCLSSDILKRSKEETLYTIAHELAHVYLEHSRHIGTSEKEGLLKRDIEADKKVIEWGFETELRQTPFNYIYGEGEI